MRLPPIDCRCLGVILEQSVVPLIALLSSGYELHTLFIDILFLYNFVILSLLVSILFISFVLVFCTVF